MGTQKFNSDIDVSGEVKGTSLDVNGAADISGNTQLSGTLSVGVNDTGHDVVFYGNTANKRVVWDTSVDHLKLYDDTKIVFGTGAAEADYDGSIYWDQTDLVIDSESDLQILSNTIVTGSFDNGSSTLNTGAATVTGLNVVTAAADGNPLITFKQSTTRRGFIQMADTDNSLRIASEYGKVEISAASTNGSDSDTAYLKIAPTGIFRFGAANNDATLTADGNMIFRIDADNDETGQSFAFQNNAGTEIANLNEVGRLWLDGNLTADTIELGDASDTTIARSAAGTVTIEGDQIVTDGAVNVASGASAPIAMRVARRTITQAEMNALHTTPIELIPAPGANKVIVITGGGNYIMADRAATNTAASTFGVGFDGFTETYSALYARRFMYGTTTDILWNLNGYASQVATVLTDAVNKKVEAKFFGACTTNCFTSVDVIINYYILDLS